MAYSKSLETAAKVELYEEIVVRLGPITPSRFSVELDPVGRRELVHGSFSLEHEFKPEPPILNDLALNFAFTKFTTWR